jgi:hypothetical protein
MLIPRVLPLSACLLSLIASIPSYAVDWNATRDLKKNELLGSPQELGNPNPTVPEWSYGYRGISDLGSTNITLYAGDEHENRLGNSPSLQGWVHRAADGPAIAANTGDAPVVIADGFRPINPGEAQIAPGRGGPASVVRWTAPQHAKYAISTYWLKTDLHQDHGLVSGVVVDGKVLYSKTWFNNDSPGYTNTLDLPAGAVVDFVMGPTENYEYGNAKFNAVITQFLGSLPPVSSVSARAERAPIKSNTPWTFTATYATPAGAENLKLRVQSTLTPSVEGSWTDLPEATYMTRNGDAWALQVASIPTGSRWFRVIASASRLSDAVSPSMGPYLVLPAIDSAEANWNLSRDLKTTELLGSPLELAIPNALVSEWSYGYRPIADLATTTFTPFNVAEHDNALGNSTDLQGWLHRADDGPLIAANTGANPIVASGGFGPINPGEAGIWPGRGGPAAVARWTAPQTARYRINAYWKKIDFGRDNGLISGVVLDGKVLYNQTWYNADSPSYAGTVAIAAGSVLDFVMGPTGDYQYGGSKFNVTLTILLGDLSPVASTSARAERAPIKSSTPWTFTATYPTPPGVTDLKLRVQSTFTPAEEGSWTDLPGNPYMTRDGDVWTLAATSIPTGSRSFRILAAAPNYVDGRSDLMGPYVVLPDVPAGVPEWNAALDLKRNELLGSPSESMNPNPTAGEWSYGYRKEADLASTQLTRFSAAEHIRTGGNSPDLHGWFHSMSDGPSIYANVGEQPVVVTFCCGPLVPIDPNEVALWPGSDGSAAVVRWTAPLTAQYKISAYWRKTDTHGGGGCQSAVVVDGKVLFQQAWGNDSTPGYTNTVAINAGSVVDFVLGPNGDFNFDGSKFNATIGLQTLGTLPAFGAVSASPGVAPVRSSNPWSFRATYSSPVPDLKLRVQSTLTPDDESSWSDLPGGAAMTKVGADWVLDTTDVPTGVRSFRVLASAPFFSDRISTLIGPFTVQEGIGPFGAYVVNTPPPFRAGNFWFFELEQASQLPGIQVRIQSVQTGANDWTDLPGGGQMTRQGNIWALTNSSIPAGTLSFRAIASAPGYSDRIGLLLQGVEVLPPVPATTVPIKGSGRHVLSLDSIPETKSPGEIFVAALDKATEVFVGITGTNSAAIASAKFAALINLAAIDYARAEMQILANQSVQAPAILLGPNTSLVLSGKVIGELALAPGALLPQVGDGVVSQGGGNVVSQGGGNVVSQGGGNLTHDATTAQLLTSDGAGLLTSDGAGLLTSDGAGLLTSDGAGLIGHDGASFRPVVPLGGGKTVPSGGKAPAGLNLIQPSFTGQLTVEGNYTQFAGALIVAIAGTNTLAEGAQQFDQLVVSGTATLSGGCILVGLFNPVDQTNRHEVFLPPLGSTFDVIVAKEIHATPALSIRGSFVWGDGLFFKGSVVTRPDGMQALRLTVAQFPPILGFERTTDGGLKLGFAPGYADYSIDSASAVSPSLWTLYSTGTNVITVSPNDASRFFRLSKPTP